MSFEITANLRRGIPAPQRLRPRFCSALTPSLTPSLPVPLKGPMRPTAYLPSSYSLRLIAADLRGAVARHAPVASTAWLLAFSAIHSLCGPTPRLPPLLVFVFGTGYFCEPYVFDPFPLTATLVCMVKGNAAFVATAFVAHVWFVWLRWAGAWYEGHAKMDTGLDWDSFCCGSHVRGLINACGWTLLADALWPVDRRASLMVMALVAAYVVRDSWGERTPFWHGGFQIGGVLWALVLTKWP